jgi:hypothetical protein
VPRPGAVVDGRRKPRTIVGSKRVDSDSGENFVLVFRLDLRLSM